jgi:hypothetical protein
MFPEVDSYEVMPWPQRIYGRIPDGYATEVNTIVSALCEMWRFRGGVVETGTPGIGTFVADSMGWQRGAPAPSDYEGFYALCLPLVLRGVPVQVLSLDRVAERSYLEKTKVLLVSYDFLKPMNPALNHALADWTRRGGALVLFGGQDAYNAVTNSWWRKAGFASPLEHLFSELGLKVGGKNDGILANAKAAGDVNESNISAPILPPLQVADGHPITVHAPPPGAKMVSRVIGRETAQVWQAKAGKGIVTYAGVPPGCLSTSVQSDLWFRGLVGLACATTSAKYQERSYFVARRGPYTAVRTLDKPHTVEGRYVNLLNPALPIVENIEVAAGGWAFLSDAGKAKGSPRLLAASGRLRIRAEQSRATAFLVQAPAKTEGTARLWAGKRRVKEVKAFAISGASVKVEAQAEAGTVLARYPNDPDGVAVRVEWE